MTAQPPGLAIPTTRRTSRKRRAAAAALAALPLILGLASTAAVSADSGPAGTPYRIADGKVDRSTYNGYRRYNAACNHCHGPDGIGSSFAPSLIAAPMPVGAFRDAVLNGRAAGTSVMRGFAGDPNVAPYVDDLYAYLAARADGAIGRGRPPRAE